MATERRHDSSMPGDVARLDALRAVDRALGREAHVLAEPPELTWQQLHNRLQWADPPLADRLTAERERRSRPGARPWIHRYSRLRESEALVRTLTGHTGAVNACAVSPDGTWIVSASDDQHASRSGTPPPAPSGPPSPATPAAVNGCAVSPDGTWIVSASDDQHAQDLGCRHAAPSGHPHRPHRAAVNGCAVSPDGTWIVSASDDHTLKIWDAATGAERATLSRPHRIDVHGCAVSPDGTWIVSASDDGTAQDLGRRHRRRTAHPHRPHRLGWTAVR